MERSPRALAAVAAVLVLAGCGTRVSQGSIAAANPSGGLGLSGTTPGAADASTDVPQAASELSEAIGNATSSSSASGTTGPDGSVGADTGTTGTTGPVGPVGGPAGTAKGVTAKDITIGIMTVQGFDAFGASVGISVATGDQRGQANAVISYINAHGGVAGGRKIVPVFYDENVSRAASDPAAELQAACSAFTQDHHVYAVLTPVGTTGETFFQCLSKAGVFVISSGESRDAQFFKQYANYFYQPADMNLTRVFRDNFNALYGYRFITQKAKVGVVLADDPGEQRAVDEGLVPALAAEGMKLADRYAVSESTSGSAEYSSAVIKFKAEGITHIFFSFLASPLLFMTNAGQQGYHPHYALMSRNSPAALLQGNVEPSVLKTSMGMGWQQYNDVDATHDPGPPSARGALCLKLMQQAGQNTGTRATALIALWQCDNLFLFSDGLKTAPDFSLTGFRAGVEQVSDFQAASTFRSSFRPGALHDGASQYRIFAFNTSCNCFAYVTSRRTAA